MATNYLSAIEIQNSGVVNSAGGRYHSLFIKTDGKLYAMGSNHKGQLGDGTTTQRTTPVFIDQNVSSVKAGHHHSLYLKSEGKLYGMGNNGSGQLGRRDS